MCLFVIYPWEILKDECCFKDMERNISSDVICVRAYWKIEVGYSRRSRDQRRGGERYTSIMNIWMKRIKNRMFRKEL